MAQKRMVDKKISVSEQVANLPIEAQLIFTWAIPHADDVGLLPSSPRTLRALIVPMWDVDINQFEHWIQDIVDQGLLQRVEIEGQEFFYVRKFREHQVLKKDRHPQTLLSGIDFRKDDIAKSWEEAYALLESAGIQMEPTDFQMDSEEKGTEVKRSEVKRTEKKLSSDAKRLTALLHDKVMEVFPFVKPMSESKLQKDAEEMDRLIRLDGREAKLIEGVILWALADSFWRQNIRSVAKLRKQFDTLLIRIKSTQDKGAIIL